MARPALIGIGGAVVATLVEQLGAVPGLAARVELHLSPALPEGRPVVAPELLARAAVVLDEAEALTAAERAFLPPACAVIGLPRLGFASLWPFAADMPARGAEIPAVAAPFGDRLARAVQEGDIAPASRVDAYEAAVRAAVAEIDGLHEAEARALFAREAGCDVRVAAFVLSRFRAERLFHSPLHPAGPVLLQVMAQLLGHPAMAALGDGPYDARLAAVAPGLDTAFADAQAPVHPAVAARFGLAWWSPTLVYRQGHVARDGAGWRDQLLRAPPPPVLVHLPADRGLAALHAAGVLSDVGLLQPAVEVARVAPFFATAIDPAVAPLGAMLLDAASGHYLARPIPVATLPKAVVLGHAGAVLHGGAVLGDTLPPWATPPDVYLPPRHAAAGRAMLGFGPHWAEDPHGITGLLPRMVACARLRRHDPGLGLLLPRGAQHGAGSSWLPAMLALLGLEELVEYLPDAPVACTGLVVTGRFDRVEVGPGTIEAARTLAALVPLGPAGPRLVYLRSGAATGAIENTAEVEAVLAAHGFAVLDADATPLAARIAILRDAGAVVGAQGPALAEIAFCAPGTAVLELVGPADPSPVWWSIASCAGLRYGYVVGESGGMPFPGGAFAVPVAMLAAAVAMMTAAQD